MSDIIFLTPNQLYGLDIGFPSDVFQQDELDDLFPFELQTLENIAYDTFLGTQIESPFLVNLEGGNAKIGVVVQVGSKACFLAQQECPPSILSGCVPPENQVAIFQRLISEGQLTLDDLAAADIDNNVYKQLVINSIYGAGLCQEKIDQLHSWWEEQQNDPKLTKLAEKIRNV